MSSKKRRSKSDKKTTNWDSVQGWKTVDVGGDYLMGAEEYGFAGLEELDGSAIDIEMLQNIQPEDTIESAGAGDDAKRGQSQKKKIKTSDIPESVEALQARLKALEHENKVLKKKQKKESKADTKGTKKNNKKANTDLQSTKTAKADDEDDDANLPRVDVSAWYDYHLEPKILDSLSLLGFSAPTHVQAECLPAAIRDGRDIIGAAQTGSGKTLAFGIPIVQLLSQRHKTTTSPSTDGALRALILAPTRELAMQVCDHITAISRRSNIWVVPIIGGISAPKQERLLSKKPEIVVATPGRLWDLMKDGQPHLSNMRSLEFLVIDEADRMVQQGHFGELSSILVSLRQQRVSSSSEGASNGDATIDDNVKNDIISSGDGSDGDGEGKKKGRKRKSVNSTRMQTFVFSATLTLPTELRKRLKKGGGGSSGTASLDSLMDIVPFNTFNKPKIVDLTSHRKLADKISEACISCNEQERDEYLYCLLVTHPGRSIVFVNAISSVRRLAAILKLLGLPVHSLHAGMQQRSRLKSLDRFRSDDNAILIATDVAARGIDIKEVKCVVHYQLPASVDVYVHRSGRTGRAEEEGISIALVTPKEDGRHRALLRAMNKEDLPEFPIDVSVMPAVRDRVKLALQVDSTSRKSSKEKAEKSWRQQQAEQLDLILSEDENESDDGDDDEGKAVRGRKVRKKGRKERDEHQQGQSEALRAQLAALLSEPLQPKFSRKFFTGGAAAGISLQNSEKKGGNKKNKKISSSDGNSASVDSVIDAQQQRATINKAVALAERVTTTKKENSSSVKRESNAKKKKNSKKPVISRAAALAAAVKKQLNKKGGGNNKNRNKSSLVVVPRVFGREKEGPDALQALKNRLNAA